ncbi:MAG: DUF5606 domain-containing protein [Bacteroidota bacterium]|nr:DUF5606 domain-containing protein [Bacteroidota bacterium]
MSEEKIKLEDVVSIGGVQGLHKIVGRSKNGIIVESLDERRKRMPVALSNKVSILSEIAMFALSEDVRLGDIMLRIKNQELEPPAPKASIKDLHHFMEMALPDFDKSRVYDSHIQKLANWYRILEPVLDFENLAEASEKAESEEQEEAAGE